MSTLCAFILNVSLCKCCFAHTIEVSLCAVVYLRILSSQHFLSEEASAGGNVPRPWRQILFF